MTLLNAADVYFDRHLDKRGAPAPPEQLADENAPAFKRIPAAAYRVSDGCVVAPSMVWG
jgi:hypothetical protein